MPGRPSVMTPTAVGIGKRSFDIVSTYHALLASDQDLTMPVAAIEALVALLAASPSLTTVSETLDLLNDAAATLKQAVANPISLSAGTDLFTRYIVTSLRPGGGGLAGGFQGSPLTQQSPSHSTTALSSSTPQSSTSSSLLVSSPPPHSPTHSTQAVDDFQAVRAHLLSNGRLFAARAKEARQTIARLAARFVRAGSTVLTNGGSRVVGAVLKEAAESQMREGGAPRFRVVFVTAPASVGLSTEGSPVEQEEHTASSSSSSGAAPTASANATAGTQGTAAAAAAEGASTIKALRAMQVPVAEISEAAVAYAMGSVDVALVGAEGVVENGGVISRLGTYQLALLARAMNRPVYVVAESHKFVRLFPLGQYDLGVEQNVVEFKTGAESATSDDGEATTPAEGREAVGTDPIRAALHSGQDTQTPGDITPTHARNEYFGRSKPVGYADAVDYTPPDLLTALITEAGVLTPSAVSEELIKIWY